MSTKENTITIPAAILVAGVIIAGSIILSNGGKKIVPDNNTAGLIVNEQKTKEITVKPLSENDHIKGNPNAPITVIEFSDTECPFCKVFHQTMQSVIDEYGKEGKVSWVYRHFPIASLHSKALKEAEATECATELGGKSAFWDYIDRLFEITPSNDGLDLDLLPIIAEDIGLNIEDFNTCLSSNKYTQVINQSVEEAIQAGAEGTPYSIILTADGKQIPINGAQPLEAIRGVIDSLLAEIE